MVSELLLEQMGLVAAEAADVARLNEAILQLAVQGKLTTPEPTDEPASVLLERIAAEKTRLGIKGGKLSPIGDEERPFPLPGGWEWVRLPQIGQLNPRNYADDNREASFVPMSMISDDFGEAHSSEIRLWGEIRSGYTHFQENDVVVAKITPCFQNGKSAIMRNLRNMIGAGTTELYVYRRYTSDILPEYIYIFFNTPKFKQDGQAKMKGTAGQQRVPKEYILNVLIPLPPLAEQKRIVERVDTLLNQTRRLQTTLAEASATAVHLHHAAIHELLTAVDSTELNGRWQFLADNFDVLYDESDPETAVANLAELKQAILQLAVQGKLTRQEPTDEPAGVLLERIAAEKKRLGLKSEKLAEIGDEERPFALPDSWEWAFIEYVCERIVDCLHSTAKFKSSGFMCIDTNSIRPGRIVYEKIRYVDEKTFNERNRRMIPQANDVLFSREGALLGIAVTVPEDLEFCLGQRMMIFRLPHSVDPKYFENVLNSPVFKNQYQKHVTGSASPHLNIRDIRKSIIPFPPLAEQKRIVARVQALLALCDQLAAQISASQQTRIALRDAVLAAA